METVSRNTCFLKLTFGGINLASLVLIKGPGFEIGGDGLCS